MTSRPDEHAHFVDQFRGALKDALAAWGMDEPRISVFITQNLARFSWHLAARFTNLDGTRFGMDWELEEVDMDHIWPEIFEDACEHLAQGALLKIELPEWQLQNLK